MSLDGSSSRGHQPEPRSSENCPAGLSPSRGCKSAASGSGDSEPSDEVKRILEGIHHAVVRDPRNARAGALRLVALLTELIAVEGAARGGLAPWQKRKVDRYLNEHLEQPMRLDELAKQIPLSVSYFCRAFKETFGATPHAYIIHVRLEFAKKLMLGTRDPLSQIALASGLADQAHLAKLFRRVIGETPSAWRRRNLDMERPGTNVSPSQASESTSRSRREAA